MLSALFTLSRPLLFALEPERSHRVALAGLRMVGFLPPRRADGPPVKLMGLTFPNRVGLAAGFDKNAEAVDGLGRLGFGFLEIGTVTPRPQPGQPRPRLFRVPQCEALINRLGFPSDGARVVAARLRQRRYSGIVGVNIGKNADTPLERAVDDYITCLRELHAVADYIAVNISSPNTAALRDLHAPERLRPLLSSLTSERNVLAPAGTRPLPLLLKVSPDLGSSSLEDVAKVVREIGLDGVIATNTTVIRAEGIPDAESHPGGVSGPPLHAYALRTVTTLRQLLGPDFPIIGVGGIDSAEAACAMRSAGADLIQLYTGFIYHGPRLVNACIHRLSAAMAVPAAF